MHIHTPQNVCQPKIKVEQPKEFPHQDIHDGNSISSYFSSTNIKRRNSSYYNYIVRADNPGKMTRILSLTHRHTHTILRWGQIAVQESREEVTVHRSHNTAFEHRQKKYDTMYSRRRQDRDISCARIHGWEDWEIFDDLFYYNSHEIYRNGSLSLSRVNVLSN